jgi:hypothetical protein
VSTYSDLNLAPQQHHQHRLTPLTDRPGEYTTKQISPTLRVPSSSAHLRLHPHQLLQPVTPEKGKNKKKECQTDLCRYTELVVWQEGRRLGGEEFQVVVQVSRCCCFDVWEDYGVMMVVMKVKVAADDDG